MTNSVSSNRPEKYNIAAFFSGVGGLELGFEQTNEFRVVYDNEFDKYARQTYQLNCSAPLQLSLSNPNYTIAILISIAELGSVALTVLGFKSGSESFFSS